MKLFTSLRLLGLLMMMVGFGFAIPLWQFAHAEQNPNGALQLYLPITYRADDGATPTPSATPTLSTTPSTPTSSFTPTPTVSPSATVQPAVEGSLYLTTNVESASAAAQVDANGGMHAAYVHFVSAPDPSPAVYTYCSAPATRCGEPSNWVSVALADRAIEVQLRLTTAGQPRLLITASSTIYPTGRDYWYAECNSNCANAAQWQIVRVTSTDGMAIIETTDLLAPQRSFALDPQGRPRFVYQDRNYGIEPDHIGFYYMECDSGCATASNWRETKISRATQYDYEIFKYPALSFTSSGQPRVLASVYALNDDGSEAPKGLYYYGCDSVCNQMANWDRIYLFNHGSGAYPLPMWDLDLDTSGNPHLALFTGGGADEGIDYQLIYFACSGNCMDVEGWRGSVLTMPLHDGQGPDIELDAANNPRIAFMQDNGDLGYAWCDQSCALMPDHWQVTTIETTEAQEADYPQALPPHCDQPLWQGLTPTLVLDSAGNPRIAHDVQVDARCTYVDPEDPNNPYIRFERVWNGVRWNYLPQP